VGTGAVTNSTVVENLTSNGGSGSGAGPRGLGGGISGPAVLANSIVANNTATVAQANCTTATFTQVLDAGHNLSFPAGGGCDFGLSADPLLGVLQNNTGPTQTMALGAGSPALDQVPSSGAGCPATDQRGITRPQGSACDIGAFEVEVPVPVPPGANQPLAKKKKCKKKKKKHRAASAKKKKCKKKKRK
jgi:hypothetical protein